MENNNQDFGRRQFDNNGNLLCIWCEKNLANDRYTLEDGTPRCKDCARSKDEKVKDWLATVHHRDDQQSDSLGYWYLATPYAKYPSGWESAYQEALAQSAYLLSKGVPIYSPIVHNHPLSKLPSLTLEEGDFSFWVEFVDRPLLMNAGGLIVCKLMSWEFSRGIAWEIDQFKSMGRPIAYLEPYGDVANLPPMLPPLESILADSVKFADRTFPQSTTRSRAVHLRREAEELLHSLHDNRMMGLEIADVLLLLAHVAGGSGGPSINLAKVALEKLKINKSRLWGKPDADGVVEHVKGDRL